MLNGVGRRIVLFYMLFCINRQGLDSARYPEKYRLGFSYWLILAQYFICFYGANESKGYIYGAKFIFVTQKCCLPLLKGILFSFPAVYI